MKHVTILIPAYNESEALRPLYERLDKLASSVTSYKFEFLFVNDGSSDDTLQKIKELSKTNKRVSYLNLSRNFGKEIAMIAGLDHANGDACIIIDADLQDPPELIPDMLKLWEEGYDDIYAKRRSRKGETFLKKLTSKWFYQILQRSTRVEIQRDTGDFRLLDRRAIDALKQFRESERYTKGMFSWIGFKKKEILYDRDPRIAGETKWSYPKLLNLAIDGITSFTTAPLRISSFLGVIVSFFAFIYILYLVIRTIFFGSDLAGYPSMMAVILFLGGVQLLSLGIIGEYIGRIFVETKQRPLYFIEEYYTSEEKRR
ncbi:MAG TPA: glycosyltransferase family 2 protein [Candidatus Saccharimonadales bacterium]